MMSMGRRVKILVATEYEPVAGDARSCFGQLQKRPSKIKGVVKFDDGTTTEVTKTGPMVHVFLKGKTPELRDDVARDFIKRGVAEPYDGEEVRSMTPAELDNALAPKVPAK